MQWGKYIQAQRARARLHTCKLTQTCARTHTHTHARAHACTRERTCTRTRKHPRARTRTKNVLTRTCSNVHLQACAHQRITQARSGLACTEPYAHALQALSRRSVSKDVSTCVWTCVLCASTCLLTCAWTCVLTCNMLMCVHTGGGGAVSPFSPSWAAVMLQCRTEAIPIPRGTAEHNLRTRHH